MNVLQKFKARKRDIQTLSAVIEDSLQKAALDGASIAGAHHLVLASLDMEDDVASRAFSHAGVSTSDFVEAVNALDAHELANLGLDALPPTKPTPSSRVGKTDATFEAALQATHDFHNRASDYRRLTSGHILAGAASVERGVAARAFASLGIDRTKLIENCQAV